MTVKKLSVLFTGILLTTACSQKSASTFNTDSGNSAIVGGTAVMDSDSISKSTALLLDVKTGQKDNHTVITGLSICTVTVLSNNIVLTAGHCSAANPKELFLVFSTQIPEWKTFFQTIKTNPLVRRISAGVTAPQWKDLNDQTQNNWGDVSLLRFDGGLPDGFKPAVLAPKDLGLSAQEDVTLAGFGETNGVTQEQAKQLMKVTVKIADPNFSNTEMKIDNTNGDGACHGDSGGPAYVQTKDGVSVLAGVTSRADEATDPEGKCIGKTIYTKIQPYLTWISTESDKLSNDPNYGTVIAEPAESN
ncbi:MAG: S1 family peptidase [Bacillota bacterium]